METTKLRRRLKSSIKLTRNGKDDRDRKKKLIKSTGASTRIKNNSARKPKEEKEEEYYGTNRMA